MSRPSEVSAPQVAPAATEADTSAPVRTRRLTKKFAHQIAVDGVDLAVPAGSVYGFLGPNGSGKTTTIRMLLGLISPTSGEVDLLGSPMAGDRRGSDVSVLRRVGALVEGPAFHPYLSGRANLRRLEAADPYADPRPAGVGSTPPWIGSVCYRRPEALPGVLTGDAPATGDRERAARPRDLLVLDEPTNGLDPQGTREVRHLVSELAADGTTVLVSSHLLSEVEQMCSHVGVMYAGRLVAQQTLADLYAGTTVSVRVRTTEGGTAGARTALTALGLTAVEAEPAHGDAATVTAALGEIALDRVVPALVTAGVPVLGFEVVSASLEDVFVQLTGEGFEVSG